MSFEVKVPAVGESITEGVLVEWEKQDGDFVRMDDPLFVLETDKVTMTINAEKSGRLKIQVEAGETVEIGQSVAVLDTDAEAPAESEEASAETAEPDEKPAAQPAADKTEAEADGDELSPAVRRLVAENQLDPSKISGSGRGGRLTKEDVLRHLDKGDEPKPRPVERKPESPPRPTPGPRPVEVKAPPAKAPEDGARQTRQTMSQLRKRIAQRLVQAKQEAAILTTFNECDMTEVMAWRARYKESFKDRHSVGLGFMSFFLKASVAALKAVPQVNAQIDGDEIVQNHFYDIGVAVGTKQGLVVPVVRDVDKLSFAELEAAVGDLALRAQEKRLTLEELSGGCFTVSNGGVYGSLLSTPILNPPQSGILGMHGIKKRPVAVEDKIEIRPMMYLALSYDHRIVDGRESVAFLRRVVECIERPERMLLEI